MDAAPTSRSRALVALALLLGVLTATGCASREEAQAADVRARPAVSGTDAGAVAVQVGTPEVVFDHSRDACNQHDSPDVPVRAVRLADGSILMVSGNMWGNYMLRGASFDRLSRDCSRPPLASTNNRQPESFANKEWISALYREGGTIHALVHNEYHDPFSPKCKPGDLTPANPCWYNSITYARSDDGGRTFTRPAPPAHLVAAPPERWSAEAVNLGERAPGGRYWQTGYFNPSNIVKRTDGYYYVLLRMAPDARDASSRGVCTARTRTLGDPASWRGWDGSGYTVRMASPYAGGAATWCTPVSQNVIRGFTGSLTYNTYLGRYILVGPSSQRRGGGAPLCGFFYSTSSDLVNWSPLQPLMEMPLPQPGAGCPGAGSGGTGNYPSLVDHSDQSVNFENTGQRPWLYYTRWNRGPDRDLMRVQVTLERGSARPGQTR